MKQQDDSSVVPPKFPPFDQIQSYEEQLVLDLAQVTVN